MEPRIQYATTSDGVNIAYTTFGQGQTLVVPPPAMPWSHLQLEWQLPELREWYERLSRHGRLVRYDGRGAGLSDRHPADLSHEARVRDLEAVVDRLGLESFALLGFFYTGPTVITYAARHPERVSHLLLWCSFAASADAQRDSQKKEAWESLMALDYEMFTETLAHTVFGWAQGDQAHRMAAYMRESMDKELVPLQWQATNDIDASALLPLIQAPTLVMHRRGFQLVGVDVARDLAARIPNAHLSLVEGDSVSPYVGDAEQVMRMFEDFLGIERTAEPAPEPHGHDHHKPAGALATILFTDLEGSAAFTQRLGDAQARELLRTHERIIRDALHSFGGSEVKAMGDGFLVSFQSASQALSCAIEMQRQFAAHNESSPETPLHVRIGLNAGEPIAEDDDLFGTAVTVASRIMTQAQAGEIVVANVVRELAAGKGFLFADRGETVLRGFEDPVRLYELRWREQ